MKTLRNAAAFYVCIVQSHHKRQGSQGSHSLVLGKLFRNKQMAAAAAARQ